MMKTSATKTAAETAGVILCSQAALRELVSEAVSAAIAVHEPSAEPPPLLDRVGLARALDVSPSTIDRMAREGRIPLLRVGEAPRFCLTEVLAALKAR